LKPLSPRTPRALQLAFSVSRKCRGREFVAANFARHPFACTRSSRLPPVAATAATARRARSSRCASRAPQVTFAAGPRANARALPPAAPPPLRASSRSKATSKEGNGVKPRVGQKVTVHCTGIVEASGKKFWSTKDAGQTVFSFNVGRREVIPAWDEGLLTMSIGEHARETARRRALASAPLARLRADPPHPPPSHPRIAPRHHGDGRGRVWCGGVPGLGHSRRRDAAL